MLGIEWKNENDDFVLQFSGFVKLPWSLESTKINILKLSASFYDPWGLLHPKLLELQIFFS